MGVPVSRVEASVSHFSRANRSNCATHTSIRQEVDLRQISLAVILSGSYDVHGAFGMPPLSIQGWLTYVVTPILEANPVNRVHTFICARGPQTIFTFKRSSWNTSQPDWGQLRSHRSLVTEVDTNASTRPREGEDRGADPQYERMEGCYLAALDLGGGRKAFTHFIRSRFDIQWLERLPLQALDDSRVALRIRSATFADECTGVHAMAVAGPALASKAEARTCAKPKGTAWLTAILAQLGVPPSLVAKFGLRTLDENIQACFGADDMFAIVPTALADAFFLRPGILEEQVPASRLPFGWDVEGNLAARRAAIAMYGPTLNYSQYLATCSGYASFTRGVEACAYLEPARCPPMNVHSRFCTTNCTHRTHGQTKPARGESRLTARLHSRLVPVLFTKLPFLALPYGGHHAECAATVDDLKRREKEALDKHDHQCRTAACLKLQMKIRACRPPPTYYC